MARARRERRWSDQAPTRALPVADRRGRRAGHDGEDPYGYDDGGGYDRGYDYGEDDGWVGYRGDDAPAPARVAGPGPPARWHAGADAALLLLRLALATAAIGHGAQVLVGAFDGPGLGGYTGYLAAHGYAQAALLAGLAGVVELGTGVLVLAGLFTAPAAAALLVVLATAFLTALPDGFLPGPATPGALPRLVLAAVAAALALTGGGRMALDPMFPLLRRPHLVGPPLLLLALAATVAVRVLLHTA